MCLWIPKKASLYSVPRTGGGKKHGGCGRHSVVKDSSTFHKEAWRLSARHAEPSAGLMSATAAQITTPPGFPSGTICKLIPQTGHPSERKVEGTPDTSTGVPGRVREYDRHTRNTGCGNPYGSREWNNPSRLNLRHKGKFCLKKVSV